MMKKGKGYHYHVNPDVKGVTDGYITHVPFSNRATFGDVVKEESYGTHANRSVLNEFDDFSFEFPGPVKLK
jgi:primosomal protein N'